MSSDRGKTGGPEFVGGIPVRTEEIGYRPDEMRDCAKCGKANPPARPTCLYCGFSISAQNVSKALTSPDAAQLEEWEIGGNVIFVSENGTTATAVELVARLLGADPERITDIAEKGTPLPISRLEIAAAQEFAAECMDQGVVCRLVSDEELRLSEPPLRVRELNFEGTVFEAVNFNTGERLSFSMEDVEALISGRIVNTVKSTTEKTQRNDTKVVDESEVSSDETVLDIYVKGHFPGFRVQVNGFDFSCLGPDKKLLAAENMSVLRAKLSQAAVNASIIDDFQSLKELLAVVWRVDARIDSSGIQRSGLGRSDIKRIATVSNLRQFNRYSRLRRVLL